jgi:hypothetical protein
MTVAHALIALAAAALLTITPGLDTALVLRTAAVEGPRRAMFAGVGICLGCLTWGIAVQPGWALFLRFRISLQRAPDSGRRVLDLPRLQGILPAFRFRASNGSVARCDQDRTRVPGWKRVALAPARIFHEYSESQGRHFLRDISSAVHTRRRERRVLQRAPRRPPCHRRNTMVRGAYLRHAPAFGLATPSARRKSSQSRHGRGPHGFRLGVAPRTPPLKHRRAETAAFKHGPR